MSEENDGEARRRRRRPRRRRGGGRSSGGGEKPGGSDEPKTREGKGEGGAARGGARSRRPRQGGGRAGSRGRPRQTRGGRRPRRERPAANWWVRRWNEVLESFEVGRRLGRGRSYARQGQVLELELEKGGATAMVQGSRDAPYLVRMHFSRLSPPEWKKIIRALGDEPDVGGPLLINEMPEGIEAIFEAQGLSLFPSGAGDLKAACSCPDQANPCKHVAAVYYLLGEEFDRDPFLLFKLRGLDRSELIEGLARTPAARAAIVAPPPPPEASKLEEPESETGGADSPPEPPPIPPRPTEEALPTDLHAFWAGEDGAEDEPGEVRIPATPAALARRLGGFPFWRGEGSCSAVMEQVYRGASIAGLDVYLGESDVGPSED